METTIVITWKAFSDYALLFEERPDKKPITTATFTAEVTDELDFLEEVFRDTNLYNGAIWAKVEPLLPEGRTHTALSVRDEVTIGDTTYVCADFGFEKVGA